ncbi:hypothetical protein ETAA8_00690 [Anatilimnocola aggregata]|uniref:Sulfatase n=1 Tax=Anatilimnocola aggregata TaxID=2528021 RepID=A0A517Y413_9BACT|nr:DUF1501 domain-containing protein [Anatilimnocola aggregata]QDU25008.1 hypothetical protein ETAA8_00690 [Anatilimnocola aggregata]
MSHALHLSRRRMLQSSACGFGSLALADILHAAAITNARIPGMTPKAKRVIFLFMAGGPSQMDLFDPKDFIRERHGQKIDSPLRKEVIQVGTEKYLALGAMAPVKPRGESGMMISDLMPQLSSVADDICLLRGMNADNPQHASATNQFHTGVFTEVRPSMGAWISYGLGTENQNLPSFVSIHAPGLRTYTSGFLPAEHQGTPLTVPLNDKTLPIENLRNASSSEAVQRQRIDLTKRLNQRLIDDLHGDANMEGMIQNMELAFRMQTTTPQLVDLSKESKETLERYGIGGKDSDKHGRACLLARKLSESGVRFVQVTMDGWDHHGDIRGNLPRLCNQTDQPVAGLLKDLKQRGLLNDTLVLWSGEFGRTPWSQDLSGTAPIDKHGREHQPESFCAWMAGGGVKGGFTFGETDEMGYRVINGKIHIHDLHATMLHLLGIDHTRLTWNHVGRDFRLTDVHGSVVKEILA